MKVQINQKTLNPTLKDVARATPSRPTLPVLSNFLIKAEDNEVSISATDLTISMTKKIEAVVEEPGEITIPAAQLSDLVATFPDQMVSLEVPEDSNAIKIECAAYKGKINCIASGEFPARGELANPTALMDFNGENFSEIIRRTAFATTKEDARPTLQGVNLVSEDNHIKVRASDGFRASAVDIDALPDAEIPDFNIVVPSFVLQEVGRLVDKDDVIFIEVRDTMVTFAFDETKIESALINGDFPAVDAAFEERGGVKASIPTHALMNACKAAHVFARDASNIGFVKIKSGKQAGVTVSGISAEAGSTEGEVDASVKGKSMDIGMNLSLLQDFLNSVSNGQISIEADDPGKPIMLKPIGDSSYRHIIMPVIKK